MSPIKFKTCPCCGGLTSGRQWPNQDTGFGLCPSCADWIEGRGETDMETTYGKRGIHYDIPGADA